MNDNKKIPRCQIVGSIYLIYCNVTDKFYVGQTIQKVSRRIYAHKRGKKQLIDEEIQNLGWNGNFDYFVLEENIPFINLNTLEKFWIEVFDSVCPNGYNRTTGGTGSTIVSDETRALISEHSAGENNPLFGVRNFGADNPFYGQHHTEETKAIISAKNTGRKHPEHSKRMMGKNNPMYGMTGEKNPTYGKPSWMKGKHPSAESRKKMSDAKKGKTTWNKGVPCSPETKSKISEVKRRKNLIRKLLKLLRNIIATK